MINRAAVIHGERGDKLSLVMSLAAFSHVLDEAHMRHNTH